MSALATDVLNENNLSDADNGDAALVISDDLLYEPGNLTKPQNRYGYEISQFNFMIPKTMTCEVVQNKKVFNLPNSPLWLHGLINIRGNITPVMDIHSLITQSFEPSSTQQILMLDKGSKAIALLVDALPHSLVTTEKMSTFDNVPELISKFCKPGFKHTNKEWYEFDVQGFFKSLSTNKVKR